MSRPLDIEISDLAKAQIRTAEDWWRLNRPKAPNAIREELERAASIVSLQPEVGTRALCLMMVTACLTTLTACFKRLTRCTGTESSIT